MFSETPCTLYKTHILHMLHISCVTLEESCPSVVKFILGFLTARWHHMPLVVSKRRTLRCSPLLNFVATRGIRF